LPGRGRHSRRPKAGIWCAFSADRKRQPQRRNAGILPIPPSKLGGDPVRDAQNDKRKGYDKRKMGAVWVGLEAALGALVTRLEGILLDHFSDHAFSDHPSVSHVTLLGETKVGF